MKKYLKFSVMVLLMVPTLFLTSCKETDVEDLLDPANTILQTYMTANGYDMASVIKYHDADGNDIKFVVGAPAADGVADFVAKYYILDIRSAEIFNDGHISGAKNIVFADILTEAANAGDKPVLLVCYTGQTACYGASLLRLYGFRNAQALKWGMSGWSGTTDGWTASIGNVASASANWTYDAAPTALTYDLPAFTINVTDGSEILKARVEDAVAAGFKGLAASEVLDNNANYYINNYFILDHYASFGHIKGAYRLLDDFTPTNLDPAAKIVTYCYTGQTSAVITAFLNVMGYEAYSLKFGMNGLWNENSGWGTPDDLIVNQWGFDSKPKDLPLVK